MSLKEITKPEDFVNEIGKLNERLEKLEDDDYKRKIKFRLTEQLTNLQNKGNIEKIRENLMRIETDIKVSEIMNSMLHKDLNKQEEVGAFKIVDSLSDRKGKQEIQESKSKKDKFQHLNLKESSKQVEEIKFVAKIKKGKNTTISGLKTLFNKGKEGIRNLFNRPKNIGEKRFTGIGIKRKIKAILLVASMGVTSSASIIGSTVQPLKSNIPHSIEDSLIRGNKQDSENIFAKLMDEEGITFDLEGKDETTKEETTKIEETPKEDLPELDKDGTNIGKPNDVDTPENVEGTKPENQIKKIYGGEISASENGILTEDDILYAVNKMVENEGWMPEEVEYIKEMIPALLEIQIKNDVWPILPIAISHWECNCGLAYKAKEEIRYFNIRPYVGSIGDNGVSKDGYLTYFSPELSVRDFGNYLRNGPPYSDESPALTVKDLRSHGGYDWIFGAAGEEGQNTFNKLKGYLEKRVDKANISKAVEGCTASEINKMADLIIEGQKSANMEMSGR